MTIEKVSSDFLEVIVERVAEKLLPQILESLSSKFSLTAMDKTMDVNETAFYLGVSKETIYQMCTDGNIPHMKLGAENAKKKRIIFSLSSLDRWKKEQEQMNYRKEVTK